MYKIYYNTKVIKLAQTAMASHFPMTDKTHLTVHYPGNVKYLLNYIDNLEKNDALQHLYIVAPDVERLKEDFFSQFRIVKASGGLVINRDGKCLFIYRRGHWDLPKGKMELGESKRASAIREVQEETGLDNVKIMEKLNTTFHIYRTGKGQRRILKPTYWYLMSTTDQDVTPQVEEDIEAVEWKVMTHENLLDLHPIYTNIKDVVLMYLRMKM